MPDFPQPFRFRRIVPALVAAALALLSIVFTNTTGLAIYRLLRKLPLSHMLAGAEHFSTFPAVALMFCVIWVQDPRRRSALGYLVIALLLSGAINHGIKETTGRLRPSHSILLTLENSHDLEKIRAKNPQSPVRIDHRDQWLLFKPGRPHFESLFHSFPSGHANAAFVIAAFLCVLYPRSRVVWMIAACLCAFSRVRFRMHFTEDVVFGAALGWIVAWWVFSWRWPGALFSRFQQQKSP